MRKRVAVLLRDGHAGVGGTHVGEDETAFELGGQAVEVVIVPGRRDGGEGAGRGVLAGAGAVPPDSEPVAVQVAITQVRGQGGVVAPLPGVVALLQRDRMEPGEKQRQGHMFNFPRVAPKRFEAKQKSYEACDKHEVLITPEFISQREILF